MNISPGLHLPCVVVEGGCASGGARVSPAWLLSLLWLRRARRSR